MPQFGAEYLFFKCYGNQRWLGKKERVYRKDVGENYFPNGDEDQNGAQSEPETAVLGKKCFCIHLYPRGPNSSFNTSQMRNLISLNSGVSRIS